MCACVPVLHGLRHVLAAGAVQGCVLGPGLLPFAAIPGWGVGACLCVCVCAPRLYPAFPGWRVLCGRVCWARVSAAPRPSCLGGWGVRAVVRVPRLPPPFQGGRLWRGGVWVLPLVGFAPPLPLWCSFFLFLGGALWCRSLVVPVLGLVVSVPPSLLFRVALFAVYLFFQAWCVSACFGCPFSRWAAALGSMLLVLGGWSLGPPLGGPVFGAVWVGVWPPVVVLVGGVVAVGRSCAPPPCPFLGGGWPVPPSAFPGLAHLLVGILCGFPVCC